MTIPADIARVMMRFNLGTAGEIAITGFHLQRVHHIGDTTDWARDVGDIATKVRDAWNGNMRTDYFSSGCHGDRVDVYHLGTDGKSLDKGTAAFAGGDAWQGSAGDSLPWEVALAVTLYGYDHTGFTPQASRKRGRMFLPPFGTSAAGSSSGHLLGATESLLHTDLVGFFGEVKDIALHDYGEAFTDSMQLGILSRAGSSFAPAVSFAYDDQFDVQVRRQNRQVPFRTFTDL